MLCLFSCFSVGQTKDEHNAGTGSVAVPTPTNAPNARGGVVPLSPVNTSPNGYLKEQQLARQLHASSSKLLQVPTFSSYGEAQCDGDGNMFFHVAAGGFSGSRVIKIFADGEHSTVYEPSDKFTKDTAFRSFSVTPSGTVRQLIETHEGVFVVDFTQEGEMSGSTRLDLPEEVEPQDFASFDNGVIVFYGSYGEKASKNLLGHMYVGVFAPSGKLISRVQDPKNPDVNELSRSIKSGAVTLGKDGNVYLLRSSEIVALSQSGEVLRRMPFEHESDYAATKITYSDGLLAISLTKVHKHEVFRRYVVLNASTGERRGYYEPSDETGNGDVCFSRKEGFTFTRVESGKVLLVSAQLR